MIWASHLHAANFDERGPLDLAPDRCVSVGVYQGYLASLIRHLKYDGRRSLGEPLGALLGCVIRARLGPSRPSLRRWRAVVVPVPLHPNRLKARGYNQAALIAAGAADELMLPLGDGVVIRIAEGAAQATLDRLARLSAMRDAFAAPPGRLGLRSSRLVEGRDVLLVDDVLTTGATLAACSTVLHRLGARRVFGCTVATGINRQWWGAVTGRAGSQVPAGGRIRPQEHPQAGVHV